MIDCIILRQIELLMPKVIQPKRHDKSLTVEDYWSLREKQTSKPKTSSYVTTPAYKEQEVTNRYRYNRPSQQAKTFNPIAIMLRSRSFTNNPQNTSTNDLTAINHLNSNTYVHQYLDSVQFRVNPAIMEVKKYTFGLNSVHYNLHKILDILWNNLQFQDSWLLLQAVIKDTQGKSFDLWLNQGFLKLSGQSNNLDQENSEGEEIQTQKQKYNLYGRVFDQRKFKNLFDTICLFMEVYANQITSQIQEFYQKVSQLFFRHTNKYIRKFSIQTVSFMLGNLQEQEYLRLILLIYKENMSDEQNQENKIKVDVSDLLFYRLRVMKGCLTAKSVQQLVQFIQRIPSLLIKSSQNQDAGLKSNQNLSQCDQIITNLIAKTLSSLDNKNQNNQDQILFDFMYVLKALIALTNPDVEKKLSSILLLQAIGKFIFESQTQKKKFQGFTSRQNYTINSTFDLMIEFLTNTLSKSDELDKKLKLQDNNINYIIKLISFLLIKKGSAKLYYDGGLIRYCRNQQIVGVNQLLTSLTGELNEEEHVAEGLGQMLVSISKDLLTQYVTKWNNNATLQEVAYMVILLLKRTSKMQNKNLIELTPLRIDRKNIMQRIKSIDNIFDAIILMRILYFFNFEANLEEDALLLKEANHLYIKVINPYEQEIDKLFSVDARPAHPIGAQLFQSITFRRQLVIYSHHEIKWIGLAFNAYQAFNSIFDRILLKNAFHPSLQQIIGQLNKHSSLWKQIMLNRTSFTKKISASTNEISNDPTLFNLLLSRVREVRYEILKALTCSFENKQCLSMIWKMVDIDSEVINLDNERTVKMNFCHLTTMLVEFIAKVNLSCDQESYKILIILTKWALGFAFTGFKLIDQVFLSFMDQILAIKVQPLHSKLNHSTLISTIIMPFLQYYTYRHSRKFQSEQKQKNQFNHQLQQFTEQFQACNAYSLMKKDFQIQNISTVQWIGVERIALSIQKSKKGKENLGSRLQDLVNGYFQFQFRRQKDSIKLKSSGQQVPEEHLLPPKQRFLIIILKICPNTIIPPYECLHYVTQELLNNNSIKLLKKNHWQALWDKGQKKGQHQSKKDREEIRQTISTNIRFQTMSEQQKQLYLNYLWKIVIESNHDKRRVIFDHIRDYMPSEVERFFEIFLKDICLQDLYVGNRTQKLENMNIGMISCRLNLLNKNILLNQMYILKMMILQFKSILQNEATAKIILAVIQALISLLYQNTTQEQDNFEDNEIVEEEEHDGQEDEEGEDSEKEEHRKSKANLKFKSHRKEMSKLLQTLFTHHDVANYHVDILLSSLFEKYNITALQQITRNSFPGILTVIRILSECKQSKLSLLRVQSLKVLQLMSVILARDSRGNLPNQACFNECLNICENMLLLKEDLSESVIIKMKNQQEDQYSQEEIQIIFNQVKSSTHILLGALASVLSNKKNQIPDHPTPSNYNQPMQDQALEGEQKIIVKKNISKTITGRIKNPQIQNSIGSILKIIVKLMSLSQTVLNVEWENILWEQLQRETKQVNTKPSNNLTKGNHKQHRHKHKRSTDKLSLVTEAIFLYIELSKKHYEVSEQNKLTIEESKCKQFLQKIISMIPNLKELSQKSHLNQLIAKHSQSLGISAPAIQIVQLMTKITRVGLIIEMDFSSFFEATTKYSELMTKNLLTSMDHHFILHNLLSYACHEESSLRKSMHTANKNYLHYLASKFAVIKSKSIKNNQKYHQEVLKQFEIEIQIYRQIISRLRKVECTANQNIFWSTVQFIGDICQWLLEFKEEIVQILSIECNLEMYDIFGLKLKNHCVGEGEMRNELEQNDESNFFGMISAISGSKKHKALKLLKNEVVEIKSNGEKEYLLECLKSNRSSGVMFPHPISTIILPILEYLMLHHLEPITNPSSSFTQQGNMASTLTLISLELIQAISSLCKESILKKELKRLVSKIKFDTHSDKKNICVVKIISQFIQGLTSLEKCTTKIKENIKSFGFDHFHQQITNNTRKAVRQGFLVDSDDDNDHEKFYLEKQKIPGFYENLEELESQEAINRNFMNFDRKLLQMEEEGEDGDEEEKNRIQEKSKKQKNLIQFLRYHVFIPLKTMLFFENRSKQEQQEEQSKARMLLSVSVTKLLIKLPLEMFLSEFQKVISKLGRLLKKKRVEVRENARTCLAEITKIVGPEMFYAVLMELKFHLRDNFEKHVFNYTVYYILQQMTVQYGDLDYCLPLVMPMVVDEIFGTSSAQKDLIDQHLIPTLKMESKKRKGNELMSFICRYISSTKVLYLIEYFEGYLKEFLISEASLTKYDQLLHSIINGLAKNQSFLQPCHANVVVYPLSTSILQLRKQIKLLTFSDHEEAVHQTTIKTGDQKISSRKKKAGSKEAFELQEEAGRNKSIFKKISSEIASKRNKQILINSLMQMYLAMIDLLIRKKVITIQEIQLSPPLGQELIKILTFVLECMDHRDNRIVHKCLSILHLALLWKSQHLEGVGSKQFKQGLVVLRKKVSRKILLMIQKLSSSDENLLRESFIVLSDVLSEVTISRQLLPSIISIIRLHTESALSQYCIVEPYKLLRTVIYKSNKFIYDPILEETHQFIRAQLIQTYNRDIRDICKSICLVYVRNQTDLQTAIQFAHSFSTNPHNNHLNHTHKNMSNQTQKNMSNKTQKNPKNQVKEKKIVYSLKIKQLLNFYLSNLDAKQQEAQLTVLQILKELIHNREASQISEYAQLMIFSLLTSLANSLNEKSSMNLPIEELMKSIFSKIDQSKILSFLEKSCLLIKDVSNSHIRFCGFLLSRILISTASVNIRNQTFIKNFIFGSQGHNYFQLVIQMLQHELRNLQNYQENKKIRHIKRTDNTNDQWLNILNEFDAEEPANNIYQPELALKQMLETLKILFSEKQLFVIFLQRTESKGSIHKLWQLLHAPCANLVDQCKNLLLMIPNLLRSLTQYKEEGVEREEKESDKNVQWFFSDKEAYGFKRTISEMLHNEIPISYIGEIIQKLIHQQKAVIQELSEDENIIDMTFSLLCTFISKSLKRPQTFAHILPSIYALLLQYLFVGSNTSDNSNKKYLLQKDDNVKRMMDLANKIMKNQLTTSQIKNQNEKVINLLKESQGEVQYFKKLAIMESERKTKISDKKIELAKLAVTDQHLYATQKSKKQRRKESDEIMNE